MDISKVYPSPVNIEGLMATVRAVYPEVSQGENGFRVHNIAPENETTVSANLDSMIANHNPNALTNEQAALAEDASEREQLLALYQAALTQIGNDLDNVATGKAALPNATLAQTRVIIDGMLTILEHQLNREARELKTLRAILRSGLG